jgi:hypothetical protein
MDNLIAAFDERVRDVEQYLDFLRAMEISAQNGPPRFQGVQTPVSTDQQKILYSSLYIQLYNLVESTMMCCIESVVLAATRDQIWQPGDLSEDLRKEWVRSIACTHSELRPEKRLIEALRLCDLLVSSLPVPPFEIDKGGGGNWDDNSIEKICKRLGVTATFSQETYQGVKRPFRDDLGPLALVKDLRNRLAHGTISFVQCAGDITVTGLVELKEKTVKYLQEVVQCFLEFLSSYKFLMPNRRPTEIVA